MACQDSLAQNGLVYWNQSVAVSYKVQGTGKPVQRAGAFLVKRRNLNQEYIVGRTFTVFKCQSFCGNSEYVLFVGYKYLSKI